MTVSAVTRLARGIVQVAWADLDLQRRMRHAQLRAKRGHFGSLVRALGAEAVIDRHRLELFRSKGAGQKKER